MINALIMPLKGYKKVALRDVKGALSNKNNFVWAKTTQESLLRARANEKIERVYPNGSRLVKRIVEEATGRDVGQFFVSKNGKFWRSLKMGENHLEFIVGRIKNGAEQAEKFFKKQDGRILEIPAEIGNGIKLNTLK